MHQFRLVVQLCAGRALTVADAGLLRALPENFRFGHQAPEHYAPAVLRTGAELDRVTGQPLHEQNCRKAPRNTSVAASRWFAAARRPRDEVRRIRCRAPEAIPADGPWRAEDPRPGARRRRPTDWLRTLRRKLPHRRALGRIGAWESPGGRQRPRWHRRRWRSSRRRAGSCRFRNRRAGRDEIPWA